MSFKQAASPAPPHTSNCLKCRYKMKTKGELKCDPSRLKILCVTGRGNELLHSLHEKLLSVIPVLKFVPVGETERVGLGVKNEIQSPQMKNKTSVFDSTFKFLQDFSFFTELHESVLWGGCVTQGDTTSEGEFGHSTHPIHHL